MDLRQILAVGILVGFVVLLVVLWRRWRQTHKRVDMSEPKTRRQFVSRPVLDLCIRLVALVALIFCVREVLEINDINNFLGNTTALAGFFFLWMVLFPSHFRHREAYVAKKPHPSFHKMLGFNWDGQVGIAYLVFWVSVQLAVWEVSAGWAAAYVFALGFFAAGLRYRGPVSYGVEEKSGHITGRVFMPGLYWVFPLITILHPISTQVERTEIRNLLVSFIDYLEAELHPFALYEADEMVTTEEGENVRFRLDPETIRHAGAEAMESEIQSLMGRTKGRDLNRTGPAIKLMLDCLFKLPREELPHYHEYTRDDDGNIIGDGFIRRKNVFKPFLDEKPDGTKELVWVADRTWTGGPIHEDYRAEFYRQNRPQVIALLEDAKRTAKKGWFESLYGVKVMQTGYNGALTEESRELLQAEVTTDEFAHALSLVPEETEDRAGVALNLINRNKMSTVNYRGLGGARSLNHLVPPGFAGAPVPAADDKAGGGHGHKGVSPAQPATGSKAHKRKDH